MCLKENDNGGSKRAYKQGCECYKCKSILCTAYLVARHLLKVINVSHRENLDLLTVTSIHSIRKNRKRQTPKQSGTQDGKQQKIQGSNRLKDR